MFFPKMFSVFTNALKSFGSNSKAVIYKKVYIFNVNINIIYIYIYIYRQIYMASTILRTLLPL